MYRSLHMVIIIIIIIVVIIEHIQKPSVTFDQNWSSNRQTVLNNKMKAQRPEVKFIHFTENFLSIRTFY